MPALKKKIAIVATHPVQYQVPVWRLLAQQPELDVHVYYGSDFSVRGYKDAEFGVPVKWDVPLLDGYEYTFLSTDPQTAGTGRFFSFRAAHLEQRLKQFRPDHVLIGGYTPLFWCDAVRASQRAGAAVLIRAETTETAAARSRVKRLGRELYVRLFYRHCAYFLAIGHSSRQHYLARGISPDRIGWSPYCVDTALFERQADEYLPQRAAIRQALGFADDQTVFIYSGKLYPQKDPLVLARAFQGMDDSELKQVGLIVIGDGILRESFEHECRKTLRQSAIFAGFVNQSQLGRYYAAADCLILPSISETWGLVVNEAMQFGRPAIVSTGVGCQADLVIDGQTGFVFPPGDADILRQQMLKVMRQMHDDPSSFSAQCRRQVAKYSASAAMKGILQAVVELS